MHSGPLFETNFGRDHRYNRLEFGDLLFLYKIDLKFVQFDPEKPYKGMIKLIIYQEMVERLLNKGIRNFVDAQKQFSQAGQ